MGLRRSSEVPTPSKSKEPARKSEDPRPESVCIPEKSQVMLYLFSRAMEDLPVNDQNRGSCFWYNQGRKV